MHTICARMHVFVRALSAFSSPATFHSAIVSQHHKWMLEPHEFGLLQVFSSSLICARSKCGRRLQKTGFDNFSAQPHSLAANLLTPTPSNPATLPSSNDSPFEFCAQCVCGTDFNLCSFVFISIVCVLCSQQMCTLRQALSRNTDVRSCVLREGANLLVAYSPLCKSSCTPVFASCSGCQSSTRGRVIAYVHKAVHFYVSVCLQIPSLH